MGYKMAIKEAKTRAVAEKRAYTVFWDAEKDSFGFEVAGISDEIFKQPLAFIYADGHVDNFSVERK